jgi:ribose-phosphate pyrophosphokinase
MSLKIFSGTANLPLAQKICADLNIPLGDIYHHTFPSGELYAQFKSNIRGDDVFLIQGMGHQGSANESLMQLLIMADAARRSSAARLTAVMPMCFYTRQDRKEKPRVPISAKLVMDLLQAAGFDRILTMDLHAQQIQGFSNLPFDSLKFQPILINYIKQYINMVIVAPDIGAVKRAEEYSKLLNTSLALIVKNRLGDDEVEIQSFVGNVKGKTAIIVDDLAESCGTLLQAAKACKEKGAIKVICAVTHGCFTEVGQDRLIGAMNTFTMNDIDEFIYSDTVDYKWVSIPNIPRIPPVNLKKLSVSNLFAQAIQNIHENKSISELYN